MKLEALQQQLAALEEQILAIKQVGNYLLGVRIERSPAGGTASVAAKETCRYARLRAGRGKLLPNGKKSQYIPIESIAQYEAACDRGKQIQHLQRQIDRIKVQIWKIEQSQYRSWHHKSRKPRRANHPVRSAITDLAQEPALPIIEVDPPLPESTPAAILVLYRQSPTTPVHAVAAEVWAGNQKVAEVKPMHCMGMRADKVTEYIKQLLSSLTQQFGILRFEDIVKDVPVEFCPIEPCPLKGIPDSSTNGS
ncbi:MAG: hypothetical protein OHK0047_15740 [Leptolyngbyaceae cyanobacterium]